MIGAKNVLPYNYCWTVKKKLTGRICLSSLSKLIMKYDFRFIVGYKVYLMYKRKCIGNLTVQSTSYIVFMSLHTNLAKSSNVVPLIHCIVNKLVG